MGLRGASEPFLGLSRHAEGERVALSALELLLVLPFSPAQLTSAHLPGVLKALRAKKSCTQLLVRQTPVDGPFEWSSI